MEGWYDFQLLKVPIRPGLSPWFWGSDPSIKLQGHESHWRGYNEKNILLPSLWGLYQQVAIHIFLPLALRIPPRRKLSWKYVLVGYGSVQFSSVAQSCQTLQPLGLQPGDPMDTGFPVHHQLPELAQTHVHWVSDAIQPSQLLSSPSLPAFNFSQHQGLFKWVSSLHQVAKVLELQLQHQSFQ